METCLKKDGQLERQYSEEILVGAAEKDSSGSNGSYQREKEKTTERKQRWRK